jgi:hypothetical protein
MRTTRPEGWAEIGAALASEIEHDNKHRWQGHQIGIGATHETITAKRFTYLGPVFGQDMR